MNDISSSHGQLVCSNQREVSGTAKNWRFRKSMNPIYSNQWPQEEKAEKFVKGKPVSIGNAIDVLVLLLSVFSFMKVVGARFPALRGTEIPAGL
jgi:hypothetical protein